MVGLIPVSEYALDDLSAADRVVSHLTVLTDGSSDGFYPEGLLGVSPAAEE
jgi:hypothetical protein